MFENFENPNFVFIDTMENDYEAFLTWDFLLSIKGKGLKIHGSSLLKYNKEKRIR